MKPIDQLWEQFWYSLNGKGWEALWDISAEEGVGIDFPIFKDYLSPTLPLLDIGCGTGIQTQFLGQHYPTVLGLDVSTTAIQIAQKNNVSPNVSFHTFNALEHKQSKSYSEKHGDMNVYLRGVLHFIPHEHRPDFLESIKILLGETGRLYIIETIPEMRDYILSLASSFSKLPMRIKLALKSNLPPLGVTPREIQAYFEQAGYEILHSSTAELATNLKIEGKEQISFPGFQMVITKKSAC